MEPELIKCKICGIPKDPKEFESYPNFVRMSDGSIKRYICTQRACRPCRRKRIKKVVRKPKKTYRYEAY